MKAQLPAALRAIVDLLGPLGEQERRENLIAFAAQVKRHAPRAGEAFEIEEVRQDAECADVVGIHARRDRSGGVHFRVSLGDEVQTLTRALAVIFCKGIDGAQPREIAAVPEEVIERIVGARLVRQRAQTVHYILRRMKSAAAQLAV